jgi:hypothetical protein
VSLLPEGKVSAVHVAIGIHVDPYVGRGNAFIFKMLVRNVYRPRTIQGLAAGSGLLGDLVGDLVSFTN